MKTETLDQFLNRGGQIRKVDFSEAYKKITHRLKSTTHLKRIQQRNDMKVELNKSKFGKNKCSQTR